MKKIILIKNARFIETIKRSGKEKWFEIRNYIINYKYTYEIYDYLKDSLFMQQICNLLRKKGLLLVVKKFLEIANLQGNFRNLITSSFLKLSRKRR